MTQSQADFYGYIKKPTQEQRILKILENANGGWVSGMVFLALDRPITQFHARIWGLQKQGYDIEGRFVAGKNWKEYRLLGRRKLSNGGID